MQPLQQISFMVPALVAQNLARRAAPLNIRAAEYAKRLFEAAYFVRCLAEKGETAEDVELDRQVRQVFMLADCEPEYIAEAIGMPVERAQRILDGWRRAAKETVEGQKSGRLQPSPSAPAERASDESSAVSPLPPPGPGAGQDPRSARAWPAEMVETARVMWAAGKTCTEIAGAVGKKRGAVEMFMSKNRQLFPKKGG